MIRIAKDQFDAWKENPVTEEVFRALQAMAGACKDKWITASWEQANASVGMLRELRARADAAQDMIDIEYSDLEEWLGARDAERERDTPD